MNNRYYKSSCTTILFAFTLLTYCGQVQAQFYHPTQKLYQKPSNFDLKWEVVNFASKDGTKLKGWFIPAKNKAKGTVIHFHGNAQNMSSHLSYVAWLPQEGYNVFLFDYRGYGKSEGTPTRKGVHQDGVAALNYIKTRKDIDQNKLFVFGQSLGGAVAVAAVAEANISGIQAVIVDSTFNSYKEIAADKAPPALVAFFVGDEHSPDHTVKKLSPTPLLVIHGTADKVVPYKFGKKLYDAAEQPKTLWIIKGGHHTSALKTQKKLYHPRLLKYMEQQLNH